MTAYIYYLPNCPKCKMTANLLKKSKLNVKLVPLEESQKKSMIAKGWRSAPLVQIRKGDNLIDEWNDFKPDHIKQYTEV